MPHTHFAPSGHFCGRSKAVKYLPQRVGIIGFLQTAKCCQASRVYRS